MKREESQRIMSAQERDRKIGSYNNAIFQEHDFEKARILNQEIYEDTFFKHQVWIEMKNEYNKQKNTLPAWMYDKLVNEADSVISRFQKDLEELLAVGIQLAKFKQNNLQEDK